MEVLCKLLDNDSEWLHIQEVYVNEVGNDPSPIMYRVRVNDQAATVLFDTGANMSVISAKFLTASSTNQK